MNIKSVAFRQAIVFFLLITPAVTWMAWVSSAAQVLLSAEKTTLGEYSLPVCPT